MPKICSSSSSHSPVWMLKSIVRDALVTSVTCTRPSVSFQISQLSTVPNRELAALGALRGRPAHCPGSSGSCCRRNTASMTQAGLLRERSPPAPSRLQLIAEVGRAPVLPDDRVVDRLAGVAIPHDRRLALVGDADRGDSFRR